jgi:hypothetical protein
MIRLSNTGWEVDYPMRKSISAFCSVLLLLSIVMTACAPASQTTPATIPETTKPSQTQEPSKPPPPPDVTPPAVQPPALPEAPATPAVPPATSYDSTRYTNDKYGFIFLYPSSMRSADPRGKYNIFEAAEMMAIPVVTIGILDSGKLNEQTEESLKSMGGTNVKFESSEDVTLADGKTKGRLVTISWNSSGYPAITYSLGVDKGNKTIAASYTNLANRIDAKIAKEVVNTLTFK